MKRTALVAAALLALAFALVGCGDGSADTGGEGETTAPQTTGTPSEGYDAMPTDGANEAEALARVAELLPVEKASGDFEGVDFDALEAAGPRFVAYLVRVDLGGQVALFEVRADGIAHNIYQYQRAFDSGSLIWTAAEDSQGQTAAPASAGEIAAAAAVESAMRDAFPEDPFTVSIHGYRFVYMAEGTSTLTFEVAPGGSLISVGM
jgi:hypothetical protein